MTETFMEMLEAQWAEGKFLCVGLDPDFTLILEHHKTPLTTEANCLSLFLRKVINETKDIVAAYKPNTAFYESLGAAGFTMLEATIRYLKQTAPSVPVILDCKRGDIGTTNNHYAKMSFDVMGADAITIHPYLGWEANRPFLNRADKGIFVLCRTSNPGAGEFQDIKMVLYDTSVSYDPHRPGDCSVQVPLHRVVAEHVANPKTWNRYGNCGLVTGATYPAEIQLIREGAPDLPLLIPGIGKQGGDLEASVRAAGHRFLVNSSSGIIFADDPRAEALKLHQEIQGICAPVSAN